MQRLRDGAPGEPEELKSLTAQERRILELVAEGLTNKQIGERLFLAEKTVKNYMSNVLSKLGLVSRTQAAVFASQASRQALTPRGSARHDGTDHASCVPPSGPPWISNVPPWEIARERRLSSPLKRGLVAGTDPVVGRPRSTRFPATAEIVTSTLVAWACRTTFANASVTTAATSSVSAASAMKSTGPRKVTRGAVPARPRSGPRSPGCEPAG